MTTQPPVGPGHGKRRTGKRLMITGLVIGLISLAATVWGGSSAFRSLGDLVDASEEMPGGIATVELAAGEARALYSQETTQGGAIDCSVTGPDGQEVPLTRSDADGANDLDVLGLGVFTAQEAGTYTATCTGGATIIGPVVDVASATPGVLGLLGGLAGLGLAFLLFVIGLILWFVGRSQDRSAAQSTGYGGPGQSYGGGQHGGGQYGGGPYGGNQYGGSQGYSPPPPPGGSSQPPTGSGGSTYPPPPPPSSS